ncbi:MAG: histidine phosphatase family protein [Deltaproteobacteria bacterium]|nr:histidine phosphatase family protein [Deltaproteobacteria bacterium]
MRLVLVRHGETAGQSSIRYYGATDVPLSETGRAQMRRAAAALAGEDFAAVYASDLARAREGARIVSGRAEVTAVPGFNEIDFGHWEGLTAEEIRRRDPEAYAAWAAQPADFSYPGGEATAAFRARTVAALHPLLAAAPPGALLFVLHKGVIRNIVSELLQFDGHARRQLAVELASIHVLSRVNGSWCAAGLDRVEHL